MLAKRVLFRLIATVCLGIAHSLFSTGLVGGVADIIARTLPISLGSESSNRIGVPGVYTLSESFSQPELTIYVDDVIVDLNGKSIAHIEIQGASNVILKNGTITGGIKPGIVIDAQGMQQRSIVIQDIIISDLPDQAITVTPNGGTVTDIVLDGVDIIHTNTSLSSVATISVDSVTNLVLQTCTLQQCGSSSATPTFKAMVMLSSCENVVIDDLVMQDIVGAGQISLFAITNSNRIIIDDVVVSRVIGTDGAVIDLFSMANGFNCVMRRMIMQHIESVMGTINAPSFVTIRRLRCEDSRIDGLQAGTINGFMLDSCMIGSFENCSLFGLQASSGALLQGFRGVDLQDITLEGFQMASASAQSLVGVAIDTSQQIVVNGVQLYDCVTTDSTVGLSVSNSSCVELVAITLQQLVSGGFVEGFNLAMVDNFELADVVTCSLGAQEHVAGIITTTCSIGLIESVDLAQLSSGENSYAIGCLIQDSTNIEVNQVKHTAFSGGIEGTGAVYVIGTNANATKNIMINNHKAFNFTNKGMAPFANTIVTYGIFKGCNKVVMNEADAIDHQAPSNCVNFSLNGSVPFPLAKDSLGTPSRCSFVNCSGINNVAQGAFVDFTIENGSERCSIVNCTSLQERSFDTMIGINIGDSIKPLVQDCEVIDSISTNVFVDTMGIVVDSGVDPYIMNNRVSIR